MHTILQKGIRVMFIRGFGLILNFLMIYLVSLQGPEYYGAFVIFVLVIQIISLFSVLGLDQYNLQQQTREKQNFSILNLGIRIVPLVSVLLCGLFYLINLKIAWLDEKYIVWIIIGSVFLGLLRLCSESIRAFGKSSLYASLTSVLIPGIFCLGVLVMTQFNSSIDFNTLYGLAVFITGILAIYFMKDVTLFKWSNIKQNAKSILSYSFPFLLIGSLMFLNEWIDKICLRSYTNDYELGLFTLANRLAYLITFPLLAFNVYLAPLVSGFFKEENNAGILEVVQRVSKLALAPAAVLVLIFVFFSVPIFSIFNPEFNQAYNVLLILSVAYFLNTYFGPVGVVMKMTNGAKKFQYIILISLIINFILNLVLIPIMGKEGAAVGTLVGMVLLNAWSHSWIKQKLNISTIAFAK